MKTYNVQISGEIAEKILADVDSAVAIKKKAYADLGSEIAVLEATSKSLREQLKAQGGIAVTDSNATNKDKILEYLKKHPLGAAMKDIAEATGVGISSVNFTMAISTSKDLFEKTDGKLWKVKG